MLPVILFLATVIFDGSAVNVGPAPQPTVAMNQPCSPVYYVTFDTFENSHNEWAAINTLNHEGCTPSGTMNIRWFRYAQFTNYQWQEDTSTGNSWTQTTEQMYGYTYQIYALVEFWEGGQMTSSWQTDAVPVAWGV